MDDVPWLAVDPGVAHQSVRTNVSVISRLVLLAPRLLVPELHRTEHQHSDQSHNSRVTTTTADSNTDPLLPALVEGLGFIHAIPVASIVAVLVAKVAAAPPSLLKLQEKQRKKR